MQNDENISSLKIIIVFSFKDNLNDFKITLDSELCLNNGEIIGTFQPTMHSLILSARIEVLTPNRIDNESFEMRQKFELLNEILEKEV